MVCQRIDAGVDAITVAPPFMIAIDGIHPKEFWRSGDKLFKRNKKKEAAQLTPDRAASSLKAKGWCLSIFVYEYRATRGFVPKPDKIFLMQGKVAILWIFPRS